MERASLNAYIVAHLRQQGYAELAMRVAAVLGVNVQTRVLHRPGGALLHWWTQFATLYRAQRESDSGKLVLPPLVRLAPKEEPFLAAPPLLGTGVADAGPTPSTLRHTPATPQLDGQAGFGAHALVPPPHLQSHPNHHPSATGLETPPQRPDALPYQAAPDAGRRHNEDMKVDLAPSHMSLASLASSRESSPSTYDSSTTTSSSSNPLSSKRYSHSASPVMRSPGMGRRAADGGLFGMNPLHDLLSMPTRPPSLIAPLTLESLLPPHYAADVSTDADIGSGMVTGKRPQCSGKMMFGCPTTSRARIRSRSLSRDCIEGDSVHWQSHRSMSGDLILGDIMVSNLTPQGGLGEDFITCDVVMDYGSMDTGHGLPTSEPFNTTYKMHHMGFLVSNAAVGSHWAMGHNITTNAIWVAASDEQRVKLWSVPDASNHKRIRAHGGHVTAISFSSTCLLACATSTGIGIWRHEDRSRKPLVLFRERNAAENVTCLDARATEGSGMVSGSSSGFLGVWNVPGNRLAFSKTFGGSVTNVALNAAQPNLIACSVESNVFVVDVHSNRIICTFSSPSGHSVSHVTWSASGRNVVYSAHDSVYARTFVDAGAMGHWSAHHSMPIVGLMCPDRGQHVNKVLVAVGHKVLALHGMYDTRDYAHHGPSALAPPSTVLPGDHTYERIVPQHVHHSVSTPPQGPSGCAQERLATSKVVINGNPARPLTRLMGMMDALGDLLCVTVPVKGKPSMWKMPRG